MVIEQKLADLPVLRRRHPQHPAPAIGYADGVRDGRPGPHPAAASTCEIACIDKRVALVGQGKKFEIWDEDTWKRKTEEWLSDDGLRDWSTRPASGNLEHLKR